MAASGGHVRQRDLCHDKLLRRTILQSVNKKDEVLEEETKNWGSGVCLMVETKTTSFSLNCSVIGSSVEKLPKKAIHQHS